MVILLLFFKVFGEISKFFATFIYYQTILWLNRERRNAVTKYFFLKTFEMIKTKLKPILPSLREKKRYLAFEVISREKISDLAQVSSAVCGNSLQFMGYLEAAKAGVMILNNKWNPSTQRGIIKVGHRHVDAMKASLAFISRIENKEVICRSLGVSGILKKAENNYLKIAG